MSIVTFLVGLPLVLGDFYTWGVTSWVHLGSSFALLYGVYFVWEATLGMRWGLGWWALDSGWV